MNLYFYITGNEPDNNWIEWHGVNALDEPPRADGLPMYVSFENYYDIPLEFPFNGIDSLNYLLDRCLVGSYDYEENQAAKAKLLDSITTIIKQSTYIDVIEGSSTVKNEVSRFRRLNSLLSFVLDELNSMEEEDINCLSSIIKNGNAEKLVGIKDIPSLFKLVALSSYDIGESLDYLLFDDKSDVFREKALEYLFENIKRKKNLQSDKETIHQEKKKTKKGGIFVIDDDSISNMLPLQMAHSRFMNEVYSNCGISFVGKQSDVFIKEAPFKRLTYQYFKKRSN